MAAAAVETTPAAWWDEPVRGGRETAREYALRELGYGEHPHRIAVALNGYLGWPYPATAQAVREMAETTREDDETMAQETTTQETMPSRRPKGIRMLTDAGREALEA